MPPHHPSKASTVHRQMRASLAIFLFLNNLFHTSIQKSLCRLLDTTLNRLPLFILMKRAMRKSDRKAEQVLGVTLTRDVKTLAAQEDLRFGHRAPLADLVSNRTGSIADAAQNIGALMAAIGAKRSRSREFSNVTLVGALKDLGGSMIGVSRKKRRTYSRRVILGPLRLASGTDDCLTLCPASDTQDDSTMHSFLDLEPEEERAKTPTFEDFPKDFGPIEDDEDDYEQQRPQGFVWDIADPFAIPEYQEGYDRLLQHFTTLRKMEFIGPLDKLPPSDTLADGADAISPAATPVPCSSKSVRHDSDSREHVIVSADPASSRSSRNRWSSQENVGLGLLPSDLEYVNNLLELNEAEEEARERRRHKRATLRSRLKKLALLGSEAREAVDGETSQ
ncbi:hypothetical protein F5I97DRAFT_1870140 [Phlebopus sp. FC_14]|nr:hypothetical protein F5I97DRAFT_1870140 [Phlebopus sp. FC_14]